MVNRRFGKKLLPKKKASGFVYQPRSPRAFKKRAERQGGRFDSPFKGNFDSFTAKQGENSVRILPPSWDGAHDDYGYTVWMHGWVGADGSSYLCPFKTVLPKRLMERLKMPRKCPICAASKRAKDDGDDDEARQLTATEKVVCWVVDRADEPNLAAKLWTMSWSMDREINAQCWDNKKPDKALLLDHPDEGYDLQFRRTGVKLNTRYVGLKLDRDPSPISGDSDLQEEILAFVQENPIPDLLKFYDTAHLEGVISGTAEEKDEELEGEEADEAPLTRKKLVGRRRDEEEDQEDQTEEDEDESDRQTEDDTEDQVDEDDEADSDTDDDTDEDDEGNGEEESDESEDDEDTEQEESDEDNAGEEEGEEEERPRARVIKKSPVPPRRPQPPQRAPMRTSRGR